MGHSGPLTGLWYTDSTLHLGRRDIVTPGSTISLTVKDTLGLCLGGSIHSVRPRTGYLLPLLMVNNKVRPFKTSLSNTSTSIDYVLCKNGRKTMTRSLNLRKYLSI